MDQSWDIENFRTQIDGLRGVGGFFEAGQPVWMARSPGRLDFFGGNVDYTGGLVLQLPLREGVQAGAQPSEEPIIRILNPSAARYGWESELSFPVAELGNLRAITAHCSDHLKTRWGRYVLGAFHYLYTHHNEFHEQGARIYIDSDLPPNCGLASSAALEIATLKAAAAVAGVSLNGVSLAEAGQWVENVVAGSACGIMDQAACVLGEKGCLLPLLCQPCQPEPPLPLPTGLRIWGIDSLATRATTSTAYETARAAAFMGYRMLCHWEGMSVAPDTTARIPRWTDTRWNGYLSNLHPSDFRTQYASRLPESMRGQDFLRLYGQHVDPFTSIEAEREYPVRAAVRYACEEHMRVKMAKCLLQEMASSTFETHIPQLSELMLQSHAAYGECGLGTPVCDELVRLAQKHGLYAAKMTGGGGGGVIALLGSSNHERAVAALVEGYSQHCGTQPRIFADSSNGADLSGVVPRVSLLSEDRDT